MTKYQVTILYSPQDNGGCVQDRHEADEVGYNEIMGSYEVRIYDKKVIGYPASVVVKYEITEVSDEEPQRTE